MISLRKSMDAQLEDLVQSTLASYRSALVAMGTAGVKACPQAGDELRQTLLQLNQALGPDLGTIVQTEKRVEEELRAWGDRAARFYDEKSNELKQVLMIVAQATRQMGDRDQRYTEQFHALTERLQTTARLNDLTEMRKSLGQSLEDLEVCVANMTRDGQDSVSGLRAQVSSYEARLEEVERAASEDLLTGLANRRRVERQMEQRINDGRGFSLIYVDLNGFKKINDDWGHMAGDDLLKQFANELRNAFRPKDLVARWGGDEFVALVDGESSEAKSRSETIDKWVNGDYTLATSGGSRKVKVSAATGHATWKPGETVVQVLQRADADMYKNKRSKA
jgi:diguanylate cyclase (GGDEF)-like protein